MATKSQYLLDRLPNELLLMIRGHGDKYDLIFHVRLYMLVPRLRPAYNADDKFWCRMCRMNGLDYLAFQDDDEPLRSRR